MAPCEVTDDYYLILKISQNATLEEVKKSYRRLAIALHPDRNPNKPDATASFQILVRAYETISDPGERRIYDIQYEGIRVRKAAREETEKRQAEAAKTEQKRAAEENVRRQKEQEESAASLEKLRHLEGHKANYDSKIFELNQAIQKLVADLKLLQGKDDEALKKERERNGWWAYFASPIYGKQARETEEQKQQRELDSIQRHHTKSIKEKDLNLRKASLQNLEDRLQDVKRKIAAEKKKSEDARRAEEARKQEKVRKEQEAKRQAEAQQERERQAKWWEAELARRRREEAAARAAKQAKEAREAKEAQERARVAQEAREAAREKLAAQQRARAAREARQAAQQRNEPKASATRASATQKRVCRHTAFWPKLQGAQLCSNCHAMQRQFAFQCPGCKMIACANCRQVLRGEKGRSNKNPRSSVRYEDNDYVPTYDSYDWD